jgi:hypothetical protein
MFNMITAVISIALMSLFLTAGISYYDPNAFDRLIVESQVSSYLVKLNGAISTYQIYNDSLPNSLDDLTPTFLNSTKINGSMVLSQISNNSGVIASCMSGTLQESQVNALKSIKKEMTQNSIIIGSTCSDSEDHTFTDDYPQSATFIFKHH